MGNSFGKSMEQREFWDFDEDKNYITYKVNNTPYKVNDKYYKVLSKYDNSLQAAVLLSHAEEYIIKVRDSIQGIPPGSDGTSLLDGIDILLKTPFQVQEMQINTREFPVEFEGLNKPKGVRKTWGAPVGPDGNLRADSRVIFLRLRWSNGSLKTLNHLKPLILHEITHTACNHVTFRDAGNHASDFNRYHKFIKGFK